MKDWQKIYKREIKVTVICFILLALTGGMLSSFFIIGKDLFFAGEAPAFFARRYILGFPDHYFWLVVLSWFGATAIGIVWTLYMDKMEKEIEGGVEEEAE